MKFLFRLFITIISLIVLMVFLDLLTGGLLRNSIRSIVYHAKSDVDYVSEKFNVRVTRHYQNGKSFTYHCVDKAGDIDQYIFLDYRSKAFYVITASNGITELEAIRLAEASGYKTNMADLLIFEDGSVSEEGFLGDLRWIVYHDPLKGSIYVDFEDGRLYLDGIDG